MAKLNIDFILIDDSVVMNGFRPLMSGVQLASFKANPVMLFMHNRADGGMLASLDEDAVLPIGQWYDVRIEGNRLLAKPDFDDNDPFALKVQSKVEGGYLKGASIWIEPMAVSDDEALKLQGQQGPTITKWGVLEASIVDIPNCRNALAIKNSAGAKIVLNANAAYDASVHEYLLSFTDKKQNMNKDLLCATLGLPSTATDSEIASKLAALKSGTENATQLSAENTQLKTAIANLKKEAQSKEVLSLVDGAIAANKLLPGDKEKFVKLATADFETTKELIDGMKPYKSIESQMNAAEIDDAGKEELQTLLKLSGHELYLNGKLERVQELSEPHFKLKYKEAFGVDFVQPA